MSTNAGRPDLDATIRIPTLHAGEPVFLLRGQDRIAAPTVWAWAALARNAGVDVAVVEQALIQADAMGAWTASKLPDADHLSEPERLQLRYRHARRAWNGRVEAATPELLLAEQRGWDAAMAAVRAERAA
jgi:hypothetical protein